MSPFEALLAELDQRWDLPTDRRVDLRIIGSSALMLRTGYDRGTKDGDVLETADLLTATKARLQQLAGINSALHIRYRVYIDIVSNGIPFLPHGPRFHPIATLNAQLRHFDISALDVVDIVVSKLKRFSANDLSDIQAMIECDLVPHEELVARFRAAVDSYAMDARAEELPKYVRHLHRIERDFFDTDGSSIELPEWI